MKSRNLIIGTGALIAIGLLASAFSLKTKRTIPEGAHAVTPFDADKYLGTWYEIARFDFKFEKGLSKTTANYSLNDDGSIHVINRGYDAKKGKWKESVGKAVFVEEPDVAMLKVSFFGPFYSGYNVAALDPDYKYALVIGRNLDYALGLEGSLKLKEISYIHSEAYASGELKHGTISLIEDGTLVIALGTYAPLFDKAMSNVVEVKARGADVLALATESHRGEMAKTVENVITIPDTAQMLLPSLGVVPLQLLAYYIALQRGCDIDKPRNLAKSVTVE